jgi:hypothetical protein
MNHVNAPWGMSRSLYDSPPPSHLATYELDCLHAPFANAKKKGPGEHQETRGHGHGHSAPEITLYVLIPPGPRVRDEGFETLAREPRFQLDAITQSFFN